MKVFVIHYTKYKDRKAHILREFEKHNICNYVFIEKYDKEDLTESDRFNFEPSLETGKISLILKHIEAYKIISDNQIKDAIIFEDDIILDESFFDKITKYYEQLPNDFDICFLGNGCGLHIDSDKLIKDQYIYEKTQHPKTRCTDSYLISLSCAKKINEYFTTIDYKLFYNIDWWLNGVIPLFDFKIYWAEPTIVKQGSENGLFTNSTYV